MDLNKVFLPRPEDIKERWVVVDAAGKTVGRLATQIAKIIRGKDLAINTPSVKTGPRVVIINAEKVFLSGIKMEDKEYRKYTGYRGNCKNFTSKDLFKTNPTHILSHAIRGMMRKNRMDRQIFDDLLIYAGSEHPHKAQLTA